MSKGWDPPWRTGLLVGVSFLALVLALLVYLVLRSRAKAVCFLEHQKVRDGLGRCRAEGHVFALGEGLVAHGGSKFLYCTVSCIVRAVVCAWSQI